MSSTVNPNRQRLLGPVDYLALMAGVKPPPPEQPIPIPMSMPGGGPTLPMPFPDQPMMPMPMGPPMEVMQARRRMGL